MKTHTQTQTKHSPGPWVVRTDREFYKDGAQPYCIATAEFDEGSWLDPDNRERWVCRLFDAWDEQAKADAALIAAAPELLAALREIQTLTNRKCRQEKERHHGWEPVAVERLEQIAIMARQAIARAEGGEG